METLHYAESEDSLVLEIEKTTGSLSEREKEIINIVVNRCLSKFIIGEEELIASISHLGEQYSEIRRVYIMPIDTLTGAKRERVISTLENRMKYHLLLDEFSRLFDLFIYHFNKLDISKISKQEYRFFRALYYYHSGLKVSNMRDLINGLRGSLEAIKHSLFECISHKQNPYGAGRILFILEKCVTGTIDSIPSNIFLQLDDWIKNHRKS